MLVLFLHSVVSRHPSMQVLWFPHSPAHNSPSSPSTLLMLPRSLQGRLGGVRREGDTMPSLLKSDIVMEVGLGNCPPPLLSVLPWLIFKLGGREGGLAEVGGRDGPSLL